MANPTGAPPPLAVRSAVGARPSAWRAVAIGVVLLGTALVAVASVLALTGGGSKAAIVLPVGAVAGTGLVVLAVTRFEVFTLAVLLVRASLDVAKLGGIGGGVGGGGLDVTSLVGVLFIGAGTVWLLLQHQQRPWRPRLLEVTTLAFFGAALLSAIGSAGRVASILEAARMAAMVIMVLVLGRILVDRAAFRRVLVVIFASAILPLAVAVYQLASGTGTTIGSFTRVNGTFLHPNPFAMYLTMLVVMGVAILPYLEDRWRYRLVSLLVVSTLALYGTYTRAAWIAALVGVLIVGLLQRNRLLVGITLSLVVVGLVVVPTTVDRFSDLVSDSRPSGATDNSLAWRVEYWNDALALTRANPLTGIGLKGVASTLDEGVQPHNDYLRVLVELGAVGLLAYLGWLAAMAVVARRALQRVTSGLERGVAVGFCGCLVAFLLLSVTSNVVSQVVVVWYFVAFAALCQVAGRCAPIEARPLLARE